MNNGLPLNIQGWVCITDAGTGELLVHRKNSIHFENFSEALARSICAGPLNASDSASAAGFIQSLAFGNGGTNVNQSGVIVYKTPNFVGSSANLYSPAYSKIVNQNFAANPDPVNNRLVINHALGRAYTDIVVHCQLDYAEFDQSSSLYAAFDNATDANAAFVFDEMAVRAVGGKLLTHVIFHPIQKSANRQLQIEYTIRIQTLTNLSGL